MTVLPQADPASPAGSAVLSQKRPLGDRGFQILALGSGLLVLVILVLIAVSTSQQASSWFSAEGFKIFTNDWDPAAGHFGALAFIYGTVITAVIAIIMAVPVSVGIALLLNLDLPYIGLFRTLLIVPMMITPVVAAFCWKLLLDPDHGVINFFIQQHIVWLGRSDTALLSVAVVNVWQNAPYVAVLLLAGLRSLPSEPLEAAAIDGASRLQMFWHVTLPLLRPYILVALLLRTIFEFRAFDNVYVMTSGGPANATMVLSMFSYLASFVRFDLSLGAAASWMMLVMSMGVLFDIRQTILARLPASLRICVVTY